MPRRRSAVLGFGNGTGPAGGIGILDSTGGGPVPPRPRTKTTIMGRSRFREYRRAGSDAGPPRRTALSNSGAPSPRVGHGRIARDHRQGWQRINLEVISGPPMLVRAAVDAVRQWRYRPTLLNNQPVEVQTFVTVKFVLE